MAVSGLDPANLDRTISPRDDFYRFANGGWLARNPIPPEYSRWGAFEELVELSNSQLLSIVNECAEGVRKGVEQDAHRKCLGVLYFTGMDEERCSAEGFASMRDVYEAIDAVTSPDDIVMLNAKMIAEFGVDGGMWSFHSDPDAKNSSWEVAYLSQSGALGIGDRDFYLLEEKEEIREKYVEHVSKLMKLSGLQVGENLLKEFMQLETSIAEKCLTRTESRDPLRVYNKFESAEELTSRTSSEGHTIPWVDYFTALGLSADGFGVIIVDNPALLSHYTHILSSFSLDVWKLYLRYHASLSLASCLGLAAEEELFAFHVRAMTGQEKMKPRWKRVLQGSVTDFLRDSLAMIYAERHFSPQTKDMCLQMVHALTEVLKDRLHELEWMMPQTKEKALLKLERFRAMIGYPDVWEVEHIPELVKKIDMALPYATNVRHCQVADFKKMLARIDKEVDPNRWEMAAFQVNAYFHPLKNVIVFPAAILQPPFLTHVTAERPEGDPAVNYAAIGAVICHEITHGYDDQGRKFDEKGELTDWWTSEDATEYERRADKMIKLCERFEVFGKTLNGKLCLGENIADFGGVKLAFEGLQRYMKKNGRLRVVNGFTPEQQFFLGWASVWRNNIHEENALKRVIMDPHAPGEFRANIVQVLEPFQKAFNIGEGDKMWCTPDLRCDIW